MTLDSQYRLKDVGTLECFPCVDRIPQTLIGPEGFSPSPDSFEHRCPVMDPGPWVTSSF